MVPAFVHALSFVAGRGGPPEECGVTPILLVAGPHAAGAGHWHERWAAGLAGVQTVRVADGGRPQREAWVSRLAIHVLSQPQPVVIAAHGAGCLVAVHLPPYVAARVRGALFVAPLDPQRRAVWSDFAPAPCTALPYPSTLVASSNDPACPARVAASYARAWGSTLVQLRGAGSIDAAAGFGHSPLGLALLQVLAGVPSPWFSDAAEAAPLAT